MKLDTETYSGRAQAIWKLHDRGMTIRQIASSTGIRHETVRAILMDAWQEGIAGWKRRNGIT